MAKRGSEYTSKDGVIYTVISNRIRNHKTVWCGRSQTVRCRVVEAVTSDFSLDDPNYRLVQPDGTVRHYHCVTMPEDKFLDTFTEVRS